MELNSIRIYAEVLEQGLDFKKYIQKLGYTCEIQNIYSKKSREVFTERDSLIEKIRKVKDVDILITVISDGNEYPVLMVEYSTAVPTDDHKWQRIDVLFWGAKLQIPMMKIFACDKVRTLDFGGGFKFKDEPEFLFAKNLNAIFYPIKWENYKNSECLSVNKEALSCIYYNEEILKILKENLTKFSQSQNYKDYYKSLLISYQNKYYNNLITYKNSDIKSIITNSSRFNWDGNKLCTKINRFGHAMDPDRGILYFVNMLVGTENTIVEIQVNRCREYNSRSGYKSLFDATSRVIKLKKYVENIIENKNNKFNAEDAFFVLLNGLNIDNYLQFSKISEKEFFIEDDILKSFLLNYPGITAKSIFFLSTELRLTDINRNIICKINWNKKPIEDYFKSLDCNNYEPISIVPLTNVYAKEDIITYACVELYKKLNHNLIAVSYPGAQGDRCILCGYGRNVLRTYVDIITYKKDKTQLKIFLCECKEKFEYLKSDVLKLKNICDDKSLKNGLYVLFKKIADLDLNEKSKIYLAVGAKNSNKIENFDVDYILLFNISNDKKNTIIDYSIAIINLDLAEEFKLLLNTDGKLKGTLKFDMIYSIQN